MSNSFWPHGVQHARLPCPSLASGVWSDSCPFGALKSMESVTPPNHLMLCCPFSSCLQSFPASGSFPKSQLFASGGQSIGASASASQPLNYKRKWELTVEKPRRHHLNQEIKATITSNGKKQHHVPYNAMFRKGHSITSMIFKLKMHDLSTIMRKHYPNPNWGVIYKIADLYSSETSGPKKTKAEEIFQIKEDWETWQLNAMCEPGSDPRPGKKNSYKDNWQNLNLDCDLGDSILSMLNFLILIIVL